MKDNVVVVSRAGFELITRNNQLINSLVDYNLFCFYSIRSHSLPPCSLVKELHLIELRDSENYLPSMISLLNNRYPISHLVSISEQDLLPAAHARDKLRLPGLTVEQAMYFRDKLIMKAEKDPQLYRMVFADYAYSFVERRFNNRFTDMGG